MDRTPPDATLHIFCRWRIFPSSGEFDLGFSCTAIHNSFPRDWHVLSCVLSSSNEEVLFTIVIEGGMLSSLPELVQPVPQAAWTGNRGQSNSLASALILIGILGRDSAMPLTYAV
jgi:hypothetical protein